MIDWLWMPFGLAVAIAFFRVLEGWADLGNRIEEGTSAEENDEWHT